MIEHPISLTGPGFDGKYFKPEAIGVVQRVLPETLRDALRLRVYASSRKIGRPVQALRDAWDIWLGDVRANPETGGTLMTARVPRLKDAAPKLFEQGVLFDDGLRENDTVVDLLGDALADVAREAHDSTHFDRELLKGLKSYERAFDGGLTTMTVGTEQRDAHEVVLDRGVADKARRLVDETPRRQRVRVMGTLNSLTFDIQTFGLLLPDGARLRGLWVPGDFTTLKEHGGEQVLLEGFVSYKPNGQAIGIEADAVRRAESGDRFFGRMPKGAVGIKEVQRRIREPKERNPLDMVWGQWPGNETDEEFAELLQRMR